MESRQAGSAASTAPGKPVQRVGAPKTTCASPSVTRLVAVRPSDRLGMQRSTCLAPLALASHRRCRNPVPSSDLQGGRGPHRSAGYVYKSAIVSHLGLPLDTELLAQCVPSWNTCTAGGRERGRGGDLREGKVKQDARSELAGDRTENGSVGAQRCKCECVCVSCLAPVLSLRPTTLALCDATEGLSPCYFGPRLVMPL